MEALKQSNYSYADYLNWDNDERWEIIQGIPYNMSPAPSRIHQEIVANIGNAIFNYLKNSKCNIYYAPFDIRLSEDYADNHIINTVVQPDLSIFCDSKKLDDKGAAGAPDWIIEVLSPSTRDKDLSIKLLLYQKHGVKEYWVIDSEKNEVLTYILDDTGKYPEAIIYEQTSEISSVLFKDLTISGIEIFPNTSSKN